MYKRGAALNVEVNRCIRTETGLMLVEYTQDKHVRRDIYYKKFRANFGS